MSDALTVSDGPGTGLRSRLYRTATLGVSRLGGMAAQFGVQMAVGALAGPAGIGALQIHMSWTAIGAELIGAGEPTRALRNSAVWGANRQRSAIIGNLRRCAGLILHYGAIMATLVAILSVLGIFPESDTNRALLLSIVIAAPLLALSRVWAETLKGLDRPTLAVTLENLMIPAGILAACALVFSTALDASIPLIIGSAVAGTALCALSLIVQLRRYLLAGPRTDSAAMAPTQAAAPMTRKGEQFHFWASGLLNIAFLQLPFLVMPWLISAEDVGRYAVAHKLVNVITTLLILLAALYGPRFARAASNADTVACRKLLLETQWLSLALFLPTWLMLLGASAPLAQLFSLPSNSLGLLLLILGAGQCINAATGLSGVLLNMSGAAHLDMKVLAGSLLVTAIACVAAADNHGAVGVATAASIGIALRNLVAYLCARTHMTRLELTHHEEP